MSNENIANDGEQFVVYYHQKPFMLPKVIASGFQFKDDAILWANRYNRHHPEQRLFIDKWSNEQVERNLHPTQEDIDEFDAVYSAFCD